MKLKRYKLYAKRTDEGLAMGWYIGKTPDDRPYFQPSFFANDSGKINRISDYSDLFEIPLTCDMAMATESMVFDSLIKILPE